MSAFTPHFAPGVVLLLLGTVLLMGACVLIVLYGTLRSSPFFTRFGGTAALVIALGYFMLLAGISLASREEVLPPGGWKYFCEIDCHLAYSLVGAQTTATLGPEM